MVTIILLNITSDNTRLEYNYIQYNGYIITIIYNITSILKIYDDKSINNLMYSFM